MIKSVVEGDVDFISASLTLSIQRAKAIDYLPPLGTETKSLYVKTPVADDFAWDIYTRPFHLLLWVCLLMLAFLCAGTFFVGLIIFHRSDIIISLPADAKIISISSIKVFIMACASIFGIFVDADLSKTKGSKVFIQIMTFAIAFGGFVVFQVMKF